MKTAIKIAVCLGLGLASMTASLSAGISTAEAQQGQNVGPRNIGPGNPGGGGGWQGGCFNTVLAGNTYMTICSNRYTARLGNITCRGGVASGGGTYQLIAGGCGWSNSQFLGGTMQCYGGNTCNWQPSQAGRQAGYQPEQVWVQF